MMNQDRMVFESPDGGETVYVRPFGSAERKLHSMTERARDLLVEAEQTKLWQEIRAAAKTNPTLQKALDRAILIHKLSNNYEQNITK
jgi:CHASE3 domain sensor protein